jgi:hypothetical protein
MTHPILFFIAIAFYLYREEGDRFFKMDNGQLTMDNYQLFF